MRLIREEKTFIREAVLLMLPMILQNFVTFSMSMADTFMVGVLGETALAAVTMANSPFYVMQLMIFGVQSGMSVLVAQYHGRGDQEAINRVMGIALFVSTTITGLLAVTAFCIPEQIMRVLTNNADLVAPGAAYTRYVGFSYFFSAISGVYIAAQRSTENPRLGAVLLTVSGALNIFLNWVLIYGKLGAPGLGCAGAAIATVISQVASCAFVLCVLFGKHIEVPITFGGYDFKVIGRVTSIGMSAFLIILFDNVMLISLNMMLQRYGGDNSDMLLTCNTIVQSFELLITMPLGGLTMGTQTILGYNLGARRPEKILRAQRYIFVIAVGFCALMTLAAQTIPHLFAGIFTKEPEYIAMTARLIRIYTLGTVLLGMQYEIVDGFTGMGVVKIALPLSVFRKVVFFACIFILPRFLPIEQIFFCEPIPPLVSILVYALTIKRVINRGPQKQTA